MKIGTGMCYCGSDMDDTGEHGYNGNHAPVEVMYDTETEKLVSYDESP